MDKMSVCWCLFLGLLLLCTLSDSQECVRELQRNMDFPGSDITFVYSPDEEHCQKLCTQQAACQFFTFVRSDWTNDNRNFYCYLKRSSSGQPDVKRPLLGVTSGFSLKGCSAEPRPTLSAVYQGVDFFGADYKTLFTADYEECQRVCTQEPGCQFFTFVKADYTTTSIRYKCHLKFTWTIPVPPIVEWRTGVVSGFSSNLESIPLLGKQTPCQTKLFPRTDIPGSELLTLPAASPEQCLSLCSDHPACTYFTYNSPELKCYLKKNTNQMVLAAKDGVTSGLPSRFCALDNSWMKTPFEGIDFRGSDMRFILLDDPQTCQQLCNDDNNCQFFTYVNKNFHDASYRRRCYLKRSITLPAPPMVSKLAGVVSGFSLESIAHTPT
ncbi:coagulation factor XI-like [Genypterus blacodes]|uniref:coagulation factor XI-like n=1 Tax=Genypterus blacodes TaxID=154954 RepID=UPI003F774510